MKTWSVGNARHGLPNYLELTEIFDENKLVAVSVYNDGNGSQKKNAALIAAAPELLEACKGMVEIVSEYREKVIKGEITGNLIKNDYDRYMAARATIEAAERRIK